MDKFDAIIIGSGQAGTPLVFKLAAAGQKVAFIEKEHFGGTCVNTGCTPTKAYVASARRMWDASHGAELGVNIPSGATIDLKKVKARKDDLVRNSAEGIFSAALKNENITIFKGEARFSGFKTIVVNNQEIKAEEIFINTGARAVIPGEFSGMNYLTNESILQLETLPEHLIIVGASYIGLEFGQMFRRFGSRVTIIEKSDRIISHEDEEVSEAIQHFLEEEGVEFYLNANCIDGKNNPDGSVRVKVHCKGEEKEIKGSHLLLAVGRKPNTDKLNLEATHVQTDERGYIKVNDFLETDVKGIFALGDCNGKGAFTHTSYNDYEVLTDNRFEDQNRKISDRILTYALYVDPPLGRAGLTKKQALKKGIKVLEARKPMDQVARAKEKGETNGFMSVLIDADTQRIVGASILATGGDEIISSILNVMYADVPYTLIKNSVIPHPTVSELIPTMLESLSEIK
jgi:pyruvate/2-oxoglutarate dehydrogenase complex dihydrolipoamide dehydrogenase (E3) component